MGDEPSTVKPSSPEQSVFAEALQRATPEARAAYLNVACGGDDTLRRRVEALLRAADNAGDFLEQPPAGLSEESTLLDSELSEKPGDRIGVEEKPRCRGRAQGRQSVSDVTRILTAIEQGDARASEELLPLVYNELRRMAAHKMSSEPAGHTLHPTALVHEAWLQLVDSRNQSWQNRALLRGR